jgi:hypothetical protein
MGQTRLVTGGEEGMETWRQKAKGAEPREIRPNKKKQIGEGSMTETRRGRRPMVVSGLYTLGCADTEGKAQRPLTLRRFSRS